MVTKQSRIKVLTGMAIGFSLTNFSRDFTPLVRWSAKPVHPAHTGRKKKGRRSKW